MAIITIDNVDYDTDAMSEEAMANLRSIQFVDAELTRLNAKLSAMTTARNAYSSALKQYLSDRSDS